MERLIKVRKANREVSFISAAILFFALAASAVASDFKVFDAIGGYKSRPPSSPEKIEKLEVVYANSLWGQKPATETGLIWPPKEISPTDEKRIRDLAKTWVREKITLVCLDIENWPVRGDDATVQESITQFKKILALIRQEAPDLKLGVYGAPPVRDLYRALKGSGSQAYQEWQVENDRLKPLAGLLDVIFPSLYTVTTDPERWKVYAKTNIEEAAKYGKPVYAFIWPRYHDSIPKRAWTLLPESFWEMELQTVAKQADGVVIWDFGKGQVWDEQAPWWKLVLSVFVGSGP